MTDFTHGCMNLRMNLRLDLNTFFGCSRAPVGFVFILGSNPAWLPTHRRRLGCILVAQVFPSGAQDRDRLSRVIVPSPSCAAWTGLPLAARVQLGHDTSFAPTSPMFHDFGLHPAIFPPTLPKPCAQRKESARDLLGGCQCSAHDSDIQFHSF